MLFLYTNARVLGDAATVISTCFTMSSSQSIGWCFAHPSAAPLPFQFDQSKSTNDQPWMLFGSVGPV